MSTCQLTGMGRHSSDDKRQQCIEKFIAIFTLRLFLFVPDFCEKHFISDAI